MKKQLILSGSTQQNNQALNLSNACSCEVCTCETCTCGSSCKCGTK